MVFPALEFIIGAEQERLLCVSMGTDSAVGAGRRRRGPLLQSGLLGVLLIGWGKVVDGILDHVTWIHGLLQAAGNAFHRGTATWKKERESV